MFIEILKFFIYSIMIVLVAKYLLVKILAKIGVILNLKPKTIGNIAGIATSIPELLTVSFSAFAGLIGASTYNILSSNIINCIQYGASILFHKNQKILSNKALKIDLILVSLTILIPIIMIRFNFERNIIIVPFFIFIFVVFNKITNNSHKLYIKYKSTKIRTQSGNNISVEKSKIYVFTQFVLLAIIGIILYILGNLLSDVLTDLSMKFNVPQSIIGILLGFITSIPELITFFESQKQYEDKKHGVIEATGNLLASNMMNLFIIQSIGIIIYFI